MPSRLLPIVALGIALPAMAINKCKDAAGRVTYTDMPCAVGQAGTGVNPGALSMSSPSPGKADSGRLGQWLKSQEQENQRQDLQAQIKSKQAELNDLRARQAAEINEIRDEAPRIRHNAPEQAQEVYDRYGGQTAKAQQDLAAMQKQLSTMDANGTAPTGVQPSQ